MATGTIKRLVQERGFGFIQASDGSEVFLHRSALAAGGFEALAEGQTVEFEVQQGPKGPRAANVRVARAAD